MLVHGRNRDVWELVACDQGVQRLSTLTLAACPPATGFRLSLDTRCEPPSVSSLPGCRALRGLRYTPRLFTVYRREPPTMEIQPILNTIKDLTERSQSIRGYL